MKDELEKIKEQVLISYNYLIIFKVKQLLFQHLLEQENYTCQAIRPNFCYFPFRRSRTPREGEEDKKDYYFYLLKFKENKGSDFIE